MCLTKTSWLNVNSSPSNRMYKNPKSISLLRKNQMSEDFNLFTFCTDKCEIKKIIEATQFIA